MNREQGYLSEKLATAPALPSEDLTHAIIHGALLQQQDQIDRLFNKLDTIRARLEPVMGPERPTPAVAKNDQPAGSRIALVLNEHNERLSYVIDGLQALMDRLEI